MNQTERWLTGELFKLSQEVASFAVRILGADIEKAGPPTSEEEFQLGARLAELGTGMQSRAAEGSQATSQTVDDVGGLPKEIVDNDKTDLIEAIDEVLRRLYQVKGELSGAKVTFKKQMAMVRLLAGLAELLREDAISRRDGQSANTNSSN